MHSHQYNKRPIVDSLPSALSICIHPICPKTCKQLNEIALESPANEVLTYELENQELREIIRDERIKFGKIVRLPKNFSPPPEQHPNSEQFTFVLEGKATWVQGQSNDFSKQIVAPPQLIHTPRNVPHLHTTKEPVILLVLFTDNKPEKISLPNNFFSSSDI